MSCSKAQLIVLLEKIKSELRDLEDKRVVEKYIETLRKSTWVEIEKEFFI